MAQADNARRQNAWGAAARLYALGAKALPQHAGIRHNQALCALGLNDYERAIALAGEALALNPALWQSEIVRAKAYIAASQKEAALGALQTLHRRYPENPAVRLELASLLLHELGDAHAARDMVAPLLADPENRRDALLSTLVSLLYDRDEQECSAPEVNEGFKEFSRQYLEAGNGATVSQGNSTRRRRSPRVGLISPQFRVSPVYYLAYGALKELACSTQLVFIHRGSVSDWATDQLRKLASEWVEAASQTPEQLQETLRRLDLDVLFDLGGWMDASALRALSTKPVPRQYKWIGGQSVTTGLKCFDGWVSDRYQTPPSFQKYYTEPLILLDGGYVTYTPPTYLPSLSLPDRDRVSLGIIANPAKVSRSFLEDLNDHLSRWYRTTGQGVTLCFIDKRYRHPQLQARVITALPSAEGVDTELRFISPATHLEYLTAVAQQHAVLDTYPYTGGLTTLEALFMGVPCKTSAVGVLFSERHAYAHCKYAGLTVAQTELEGFLPDTRCSELGGRQAFVRRMERRTDHSRLAEQLLNLVKK